MYVNFISDEHFQNCVRNVLSSFRKAVELKESVEKSIIDGDIFKCSLFNNVVDPFKMIFEIEKISMKEWIKKEMLRQLDKSVEQKMGEFHQEILGGVDGWTDLKIGKVVDLVNEDKTAYLEVKNKYNTTNGKSLNKLRESLEEITKENHNANAYWAYIIANTVKKSGEEIWVKKGYNKIDSVKKIWGEKVYEMITGDALALEKIYTSLPTVISDVINEDDIINVSQIIEETVLIMEEYLPQIRRQIYSKVFR